ncbi:MAG: twin-arginine translocase subunit TatC, partial [Mycobacteriales bacterium]
MTALPAGRAGRPKRPSDGRMALADHLRELRNRMGISLLALAIGVVVAFIFWRPIYDFLRQPYCSTGQGEKSCNLYALGIFDQFLVRMKVSFIAGGVLTAPVWLYQLGAFITPALHRKERKYAAAFLGSSLVLFSIGCTFAYLTVSRGLDFLLSVGGGDIVTLLSIQS